MKDKASIIRLIYPQRQGGGSVAEFLPELPAEDAYKGYYLGAQLLSLLAPESGQRTVKIPVSLDINDRAMEKGIISYRVILKQTKAAQEWAMQNLWAFFLQKRMQQKL
ncbi:MAG: hypothetical protein LBT93_07145 [Treponema sp.]|jgi:arginase|nr:hypothetical protein [Treponema sp.]